MVKLGDKFPNFSADSTAGKINFYDWVENSWCVFFSHPNAFTPVCTTELARVAQLMPEFDKRNVKVIAYACDPVPKNEEWIEDIKHVGKISSDSFPFPIIGDESRSLATKLDMLDPEEKDQSGAPVTCRSVFVVDPNKSIKLLILYPATTGRNFDEILRAIDSLQLTHIKKVATPADWKVGNSCMVLPTLSEKEALELFPAGITCSALPSNKGYMRSTPYPKVDQ